MDMRKERKDETKLHTSARLFDARVAELNAEWIGTTGPVRTKYADFVVVNIVPVYGGFSVTHPRPAFACWILRHKDEPVGPERPDAAHPHLRPRCFNYLPPWTVAAG
jgi:hypothetical protein